MDSAFSPLPPRHAYVNVTRLTYEMGGQQRQFFKVEGLRRRSADWLGDGAVPSFEGKRARFVVERLPGGKLRFVRQVVLPERSVPW